MPPAVLFVRRSENAKLGPMPATYSARATCPDACPLKRAGCYAQAGGHTRLAWNRADHAGAGSWRAMLAAVRALPEGTVWRHNVAGDLPGRGDALDVPALRSLAEANRGRRGFTYTHKPVTGATARALRAAHAAGFTVNLSADTPREADALARHGLPVVCLVPRDWPEQARTPGGRRMLVCPEQTGKVRDCLACGACANPRRAVVIAFRAHGAKAKEAETVARGGP